MFPSDVVINVVINVGLHFSALHLDLSAVNGNITVDFKRNQKPQNSIYK